MEWLNEMPPAACPWGCVVRKGGLTGVVTLNKGGRWSVVAPDGGVIESGVASYDDPTGPEAAGWRHALSHRAGLWYVLDELNNCDGDAPQGWSSVIARFSRRDSIAADLLLVARTFAKAVS